MNTIPALVAQAAERFADREGVVDGDRRVSFAELARLVSCATTGCRKRGVEPGDRVAVWGPNTLEWVVAALGAVSAGAALVPLNTRFKGDEVGYVLDKSRARFTSVSPPFLGNDYPGMLGGRPSVLLDEAIWAGTDPADLPAVSPDDVS